MYSTMFLARVIIGITVGGFFGTLVAMQAGYVTGFFTGIIFVSISLTNEILLNLVLKNVKEEPVEEVS